LTALDIECHAQDARKQRGQFWTLDERGKQMTSIEFAEDLGRLKDRGEPVTFLLGGAYGLSDEARSAAHRTLSLSRMTLPHELCRIVFLEQLYRAIQINKGSGYHH
jgi:23S rRNA (pseudouridine1915-N3)-methyltransferase